MIKEPSSGLPASVPLFVPELALFFCSEEKGSN